MLILNSDLVNSCRVCRSPNQDGDYQCLYQTLSDHVDCRELSEAGLLYENLLDISLNEWHSYPQFLCNSCDLQMKLFKKLKDKAFKTLAYLQNLINKEMVDGQQSIEKTSLENALQKNEQLDSGMEAQYCQDDVEEYKEKFEFCQEDETNQYEGKNDNENLVDENISEKNVDLLNDYQTASGQWELDNIALNNSYNQEKLERKLDYTEQEISNSSTTNVDAEMVFDSLTGKFILQIVPKEKIKHEVSSSSKNLTKIKLEPGVDKNDYISEIFELIDETELENNEMTASSDSHTENATYNDIEYLFEENLDDRRDEKNKEKNKNTFPAKKKGLNNEEKMIISPKKRREYNCISCQLELKNYQEYKLHRAKEHNGEFICGLKTHVEPPSYQCEICQKTFFRKFHFQYHMNRHNNIRNFKCNICAKAFIAKADLKTHLRLHTGERPYVCNICGKDYLMMEHLKTHLITHTDQHFKCDVCNKNFSTHKTLRLHVRTIHEDEPKFKCTYCMKPFRRKHHLKYHMKSHQRNNEILDSEIIDDPGNLDVVGEQDTIEDPGFIALNDDL